MAPQLRARRWFGPRMRLVLGSLLGLTLIACTGGAPPAPELQDAGPTPADAAPADTGDLGAGDDAAVAEDAAAFEAVLLAVRLPRETAAQTQERAAQIENATLNAARIPLAAARMAVRVIDLAAQVVADGNLNAISDGVSGASMARAALTAAGTNVRINIESLSNKASAADLLTELKQLESQAASLEGNIRQSLESRAGFSF